MSDPTPPTGQLDWLADSSPARPDWIARLQADVARLAARQIFLGTSSWKYPGWLGQLYTPGRYATRGRFSRARFERECLAEYAAVFPSVCGDFAFYQFYPPAFWEKLFAQVPATFQFGFKAPEQITCPRFPRHDRYGALAGRDNPDFLNAALFADRFLAPLEPHQRQIGYIVLEFPRFHELPGAKFIEQLDRFLARLPATIRFGVELRTTEWLNRDYLECLRRHGVAHVFNSWTHMPPIGAQLDQPGSLPAGHVIVRALLRPGRAYEEAVSAFQPYDSVKDPFPEGDRDVARVAQAAAGRRVYIAVNNRFVGSALRAIESIIAELESGACTA